MYSNLADLSIFMTALTQNKLLTEKSKQLLFTPNKGNYGYGFEITSFNGVQMIGHSGAIDGFKSNLFTIPSTRTTVIVLANYGDVQTFELYEALKRIALGMLFEMPKEHVLITIPSTELQNYVGEYFLNDQLSLILKVNEGKLVADIAGETGLVLYPETEDSFYIRAKNAYLKLVKTENGEVTAVKVGKGERTSTWLKRK